MHEAREMHAKAVAEILPVREDVDAQPSWPAKSKGTEAPKLIKKTEPAYALLAKGLMVRGVVLLSIVIEADGTPSSATLKKRLGWGLDEEAAKTVKQWRFKPGMRAGKPVRTEAQVEIRFALI